MNKDINENKRLNIVSYINEDKKKINLKNKKIRYILSLVILIQGVVIICCFLNCNIKIDKSSNFKNIKEKLQEQNNITIINIRKFNI